MKIHSLIFFSCVLLLLGCRQLMNYKAERSTTQSYYTGNRQWVNAPNKTFPTDEQWIILKEQYNTIPKDIITVAEQELDEEITSADCYKYMFNSDSTKFLAFFIQEKNKPSYEKLTRFGQTVRQHNRTSDKDSIEYYGYHLWGMNYEDNWYYHKDVEDEFWGYDIQEAQLDFVHHILSSTDFFLYYLNNEEAFWTSGGRTKVFKTIPENSTYLEEFSGYPEIVGWHEVAKSGRQKQILNEQIEKTACEVEDDLWYSLNQFDNNAFYSRYKSKFSGDSCTVLYNSSRNKVLLPLLYFDSNSQPWVSYYYLKFEADKSTLYKWTKFPTKKINRGVGSESLEIVDDIRTCIDAWNWGTVNMINNDSFWTDNFKEIDLEKIE